MTDAPASAWAVSATGLRVRVRLTPKSSRDAIGGAEPTAEGPALKAWVRAVPEDGKANDSLVRTFAGWLGVPRSTVSLVSGSKARCKTLAVAGDGPMLAVRLAGLIGAETPAEAPDRAPVRRLRKHGHKR